MNKFTKIISVMLAVILMVTAIPFTTFAAQKGDVDGNGQILAVDARLILQYVAGLKTEADFQNAAGADVDGNGSITAVDARKVLQMVAGLEETPSEPETPVQDERKAQLAALFNAETAKVAKGNYKWTRKCDFVKAVNVGNATETLNNIIKAIDANADLNSVVGGFLGVGNASGNQTDAGKYALIAMNLTESDIKKIETWVPEDIVLVLNDASNPEKGGNSSFSHVSNDIVTKKDVEDQIKAAVTGATINDFSADYHEIKLSARIKNNKPVSLTITYKLSATLGAKAYGMNISGDGTIETTITYTVTND